MFKDVRSNTKNKVLSKLSFVTTIPDKNRQKRLVIAVHIMMKQWNLKVYVFLARKQIWQTIFLSVTTVTVKMVDSFIFVAWITEGFLTTIEPHGCAGTVKLVEHTNQQSRVLHKPLSKQKRPQLPPVLLLTYLHHSHLVKQTLPQKHWKWWLQWWWSLNNSHSRIHWQKGTFR